MLLGLIKDYPAFDKSLITKEAAEKPIEVETIEVHGEAEKTFSEGIKKESAFNAQRPAYMSEASTRKLFIVRYCQRHGRGFL